jgi:hypothetical protein
VTGEDCLGEVLEGNVVGVVFVHVDLFDHHLTLCVDLLGPKRGALDDLREDVESGREILIEQPGPEASHLL